MLCAPKIHLLTLEHPVITMSSICHVPLKSTYSHWSIRSSQCPQCGKVPLESTCSHWSMRSSQCIQCVKVPLKSTMLTPEHPFITMCPMCYVPLKSTCLHWCILSSHCSQYVMYPKNPHTHTGASGHHIVLNMLCTPKIHILTLEHPVITMSSICYVPLKSTYSHWTIWSLQCVQWAPCP